MKTHQIPLFSPLVTSPFKPTPTKHANPPTTGMLSVDGTTFDMLSVFSLPPGSVECQIATRAL